MLTNDKREDFNSLLRWLEENNLVGNGRNFEMHIQNEESIEAGFSALGFSSNRVQKKSKAELKNIIEKYGELLSAKFQTKDDWDRMYADFKKMQNLVVDYRRINPDALAFYRPFHFKPFYNWGVYLLVNKINKYFASIKSEFQNISFLSDNLLMSFILFEVFHHEFFHHLVESTVASFEVLHKGFSGQTRAYYLNYCSGSYKKYFGNHVDDPLEEALANAYAYNSFSFISGVHNSFMSFEVKYYQKILERNWLKEPAGYRSAANYIYGNRFNGANDLLLQIICSESAIDIPLDALSNNFFPNGNYSLFQKPYIPVYLVGKEKDFDYLYELIPAPHETYNNLFWPGEVRGFNDYIKERKKDEKQKREEKKISKSNSEQTNLFTHN